MSVRRRSALFIGIFLICLALTLALLSRAGLLPFRQGPAAPATAFDGLSVHIIDVGQGDAILLRTPEAAVLIDGGPRTARGALLDYLAAQKIESFDLAAATHPHEDHIGSLDDVIAAYPVKTFLTPLRMPDTPISDELRGAVSGQTDCVSVTAEAGQTYAFGALTLTVLSPDRDAAFEIENDRSLVLLAEYCGRCILLTGDAEAAAEHAFLARVPDRVDLIKVGHHGSATSSTPELLRQTRPRYAVISVGAGNDYGHPHRSVLDRLEDLGTEVYRTDLDGSIVFFFSPDGDISVWTEKQR